MLVLGLCRVSQISVLIRWKAILHFMLHLHKSTNLMVNTGCLLIAKRSRPQNDSWFLIVAIETSTSGLVVEN